MIGDTKDGAFWRHMADKIEDNEMEGVSASALVKIKDLQANEDAMDAGNGLYLEDREVAYVKRYTRDEQDIDAEWLFFYLPGAQELALMVRIVDNASDIYILYRTFEQEEDEFFPLFENWNKQDLIDDGNCGYFCAPEDSEDFVAAKLEWAQEFTEVCVDRQGEAIDAAFTQAVEGTQYVEESSFGEPLLCGITEFTTDANIDNPHMVILESGLDYDEETGEGKAEGGLVEMYQGCEVKPFDIEFILITE